MHSLMPLTLCAAMIELLVLEEGNEFFFVNSTELDPDLSGMAKTNQFRPSGILIQ
jgi:hypothetical protein